MCPLNLLPLLQHPEPLFPELEGSFDYKPGDFPHAEAFHHNTLKLPVWHREEDRALLGQYLEALQKATTCYRDMLE